MKLTLMSAISRVQSNECRVRCLNDQLVSANAVINNQQEVIDGLNEFNENLQAEYALLSERFGNLELLMDDLMLAMSCCRRQAQDVLKQNARLKVDKHAIS